MFKKIIFLLIFMGLKYAYAQEGPKNIISDKKSNLIIKQ